MHVIKIVIFLDPQSKNAGGENVLNITLQSECDDEKIAEVAEKLLKK